MSKRGHYTFDVKIAIEAESEESAEQMLYSKLQLMLTQREISGHGIDGVAYDLTYDMHGALREPA